MDVVLVSLGGDLQELRSLVASAGHRVVGTLRQRRRPDPTWYVGRGKVGALRRLVEETGAGLVVVSGELRPSQHYHLEKALGVECFDRLRLILEVFAQRAHSREARLQVELAQLRYQVPVLREWIHRAKTGERPGFMAGGEYRVDVYYERIRTRMRRIRDALEGVRRERDRRRQRRKERGYDLVALAGYTNAGKSSLLNALTGERVVVEERMFSTLSPVTRRVPGGRENVLLTDTVGLIDNVPLWLIEAFHSTLEEIYEGDLILLVLDASDPPEVLQRRLQVAVRVLTPQTPTDAVLPVLSKQDAARPEDLAAHREILEGGPFARPPAVVSARTGYGLEDLVRRIRSHFRLPLEFVLEVDQGPDSMRFLQWIQGAGAVDGIDYRGNRIVLRVRCRRRDEDAVLAAGRVLERRERADVTA